MMRLQLSASQRYRLCQIVSSLGLLAAVYFLRRTGPYETPHHNKLMFAMLMISVVGALPFAIGAYYYRSKRYDIETGVVQVEALAQASKGVPSAGPSKKEKSR